MNIIEAIHDKNLFRPYLAGKNGSLKSWRNWETVLRCIFGLPVNSGRSQKLIRQVTGRNPKKLPKGGFDTSLLLCGRRSGKSKIVGLAASYLGILAGLEKRLSVGEKGVVAVVSSTLKTGGTVKDYIRGACDTPMLRRCIESEQKDGFTFTNGVSVQILPSDFRHVRGRTLLAAIVDEVCFLGLEEDSRVRSDVELLSALEPSLATVSGKLIALSSPHAMRGWAYETYREDHANDKGDVLVVQAKTTLMNDTIPGVEKRIARAMRKDLAKAKSEWLAEFRSDVILFVSRDMVEALVEPGRQELLPSNKHKHSAFVDMSGGRSDASALAIGHRSDNRKIVLDYCRQWKSPANPHEVCASMADVLKKFGVAKVVGDQYAGEWPVSAFATHDIKYVRAPQPKSQIYIEFLPVLTSKSIELLDSQSLITQLCSLERRTRSGARDQVDHPRNSHSHDDLANAVAGMAVCGSVRRLVVGAGGF